MNDESRSNPFGMDEDCRNCQALCESRTTVVHGYGDVAADFCFVAERPSAEADEIGVPFAGDASDSSLQRILQRLGLCDVAGDPDRPSLVDVYLTHLTRCRHPDRAPTDREIENCEPFLDSEIRMINPEIIVPIGQVPLEVLAAAYTTTPPDELDVREVHATSIRGRGFELVPMIEPAAHSEVQTQEWIESFAALMASDYRQTKGRRRR